MSPSSQEHRVSAVIPAFNAERTIAAAIRSALDQTYPLAEIIVVDDGSSDRTGDIVRTYPQVHLIQQDNRGVGAARNAGICAATGDWIAFLDSDDAWKPEKTAIQVKEITEDAGVIYDNGFDGVHFGALWHRQAHITPSGALVRKTALEEVGGFEEARTIMAAEDLHLWLKIALTDWRFIRGSSGLFYYQPTEQSLSANDSKMVRAELTCFNIIGEHVGCQNAELERIEYATRIEYSTNLVTRRRWEEALSVLQGQRGRAAQWLRLVITLRINRGARRRWVKRLLCHDEDYNARQCSGECRLPSSIKEECMATCHRPYFRVKTSEKPMK